MHRLISRGKPGAIPGLPPILSALLIGRGIDTQEKARAFLRPEESQISDPFLLDGMDLACGLIQRAIQAGEAIAVYGDYDCDGVCASVILWEALEQIGAQADIYIPHRKEEGYGLNEAAVRRLAADHRLLITVDCGITSAAETALAKELGMTVIVTDHHTPPETLPPADAMLHPAFGAGCSFLCGAGVAYKLACALTGAHTLPTVELCALATIADMVPLLEENRALAALGLDRMRATRRPGLRALLSAAGIPAGEAITGTQAAFQLAPRINACGRMDTARIAVELLTTRDPLRASALAAQADALNARRKNIEQRVFDEADAQVRASDLCARRAIVVMGEGWESGVVGLVAGRLAERYGYPSVALTREGDACVGSARSACGVDLFAALSECRDLFTRFGGHKQAAGLTLREPDPEPLAERLSQAVEKQLQGRPLMPETAYDAPIRMQEITLELIDQLRALEPFGMGNPAPVFLLQNAEVLSARAVGAEGAHLKLTLGQDGAVMDAIAFRMGSRAGVLQGLCDLAVTPVANAFGGRVTAECRVEAIGGAAARFRGDEIAESHEILQELIRFCRIDIDSPPARLLSELPAPEGSQGTLYLCRAASTAQKVAERFPGLDVADRAQPQAYNAVARCGETRFLGPYRRVVLCDGPLCKGETGFLKALYPQAELLALPRSEALNDRLLSLRFTVEALRGQYVRLRSGQTPDLSQPREAAMASVLQDMELIGPRLQILPLRKSDPLRNPLYQTIQGSDLNGDGL